jgi:outer membrane usher protein FimD/PapC
MWTLPAAADPGRARTAFLPLLCVLLAVPAPAGLRAQEATQLAGAAAEIEEVIATLRVNGLALGEFTVARAPADDFWLRAADLPRLELPVVPEARRSAGGTEWVSARALGARALSFDEATLTLSLQFGASALSGTRIDLGRGLEPLDRAPARNSLVLSYRLSAIQAPDRNIAAAGVADINGRVDGVLLRQELRLDTSADRRGIKRGVTQLVWDDLKNARRLAAGDVFSTAGAYGSSLTGAGVLFQKVYELAPDLVRQPMAHLQAATSLPADVEVSVDGSPVYRGRVAPGPIHIDNLLASGGTRNVRVVITDAAGGREVIEQAFLFTDSVLAQGLHEYSYFAGRRSQLDASGGWRYREPAWQAYHRYGASDHITVSAGGEGSGDFHNGGAGITLRSDPLGLLAVDLLTSRDHGARTEASGWSARYTAFSRLGTVVLAHRAFEPGFRTFTTGALDPFPRRESRLGVSTYVGRVSVSADLVRTVTTVDRRDTGFVRVGTGLGRGWWLMGEWQTTRVGAQRGWAGNVYLRADLDQEHWIGTTARVEADHRRMDVEAGKLLPDGEGYGYRMGTSTAWERASRATTRTAFAAVDWNLRPATVSVFASTPLEHTGQKYLQADVAGALVGLDGYWGLTRQINDAFVLARLGVPQPGVEVLMNNRPQGRTDAQGRLLIPQVSSFGRQELSLNEQDLGIEYMLRERQRTIAPPYRSGTVVDFGIRRMRAVAGMAWQVDGGQRQPIAARTWTMAGGAGQLRIETSRSGDFYLEDAAPGSYTGTVSGQGRTYACRLQVPASGEAVQELKEGIVCE